MTLNYTQARAYIEETNRFGSVLGLENMYNLLDKLGNPQKDLKFIHIAGTNGKGSTLAFISTILKCNGYIVGRYISPTIFDYRERIQVNEEYIEDTSFAQIITRIKQAIDNLLLEGKSHPTAFEIETALAFIYFVEKKCDIVVLETGLGGKLDATNVIATTICSVFTTISMDHMQILGNTLTQIATQKAGIIKTGGVVISTKQEKEAKQVLIDISKEKNTNIEFVNPSDITHIDYGFPTQSFRYKKEPYSISLAGSYQIINATLAIKTIECLNSMGWNISNQAIRHGLLTAKWIGRFTQIHSEPLFIVDGAHNEDAARQLRESIEIYFPDKTIIFIIGVLADKDYKKIIEITAPLANKIITIETPNNDRALPANTLAMEISNFNSDVQDAASLKDAVDISFSLASKDDVIIAFGSLSYLGDLIKLVSEMDRIENTANMIK